MADIHEILFLPSQVDIDIEYLDSYKNLNLPKIGYQHKDDACADLYSVDEVVLPPKCTKKIPTGIKTKFEKCVMLVFPRSSTHKKYLTMANNVGVIDPGYRGEIKLPFLNFSRSDAVKIEAGERIAQFLLMPLSEMVFRTVESVPDDSTRGEGGFGSTGNY